MMYTLDTSFFIEVKNLHMPIDKEPSFWSWLVSLAEQKVVLVHKDVYQEITAGNDSLAQWMKDNKDVFVDKNIAIDQISKVMNEGYGIVDEVDIESFKADPWVVAHAISTHRTVVTSEKPGKQTSPLKKKISSVCDSLHVPWCTITSFLWQMRSYMPSNQVPSAHSGESGQ